MSIPIPIVIPQPKTRKGFIILVSVLGGIFLIGASLIYYFWSLDQKKLEEHGQPAFNTLSADQLEDGMIVKGTIDLAFDYYAEAYETNFGIRSNDDSEDLYYVVPVYDVDSEGMLVFRYLITYDAQPKRFEIMNKVVEQTWTDTPEITQLNIENAVIRTLTDDLKQYYQDWAQDPQFYEGGSFIDWCAEYNIFGTQDKDAINAKMVPFMVYETAQAGIDFSLFWGCIGGAVFMFILLLILLLRKKPIKGVAEDRPLMYDDHFRQARKMFTKSE